MGTSLCGKGCYADGICPVLRARKRRSSGRVDTSGYEQAQRPYWCALTSRPRIEFCRPSRTALDLSTRSRHWPLTLRSSSARARESRDITVPIAVPVIWLISAYVNPSISRRIKISRWKEGSLVNASRRNCCPSRKMTCASGEGSCDTASMPSPKLSSSLNVITFRDRLRASKAL